MDSIKKLIKQRNLTNVDELGEWHQYKLFSAYDPKHPYIGPPQYILKEDKDVRWATWEEIKQIMKDRAEI